MGAVLTLWPNAHRARELAELLSEHACTVTGLAGDLGVSANDVEHIVARLRANGLPVATVYVGDDEPLYRLLYPAGRVCAAEGCGTLLRRSNPADTCELHGGGELVVALRQAARRRAPARPVAPYVDWRALRQLCGLSQREAARRAGVHFTVLSRVERGQRRATPDVAQRLARVMRESVRR